MVMRPQSLVVAAGAAVLAACGFGCAPAPASQVKAESRDMQLTVYSGGFGMVQETRKLNLQAGRTKVFLPGLPEGLSTDSLMLQFPKDKDASVAAITFSSGTAATGGLLERLIGKEIDLVYRGQDGRVSERRKGTLLSAGRGGEVIVQTGDKVLVNPSASIEASTADGGSIIPQLSAEIEAKSARNSDLSIGYLTPGLSWQADYNFILPAAEETLKMELWASVQNSTNVEFEAGKINFVAGTPNRALDRTRMGRQYDAMRSLAPAKAAAAEAAPGFEPPEMAGELYSFPYTASGTIRPGEVNRVRMMSSDAVKVERDYSITIPSWGWQQVSEQEAQRQNAVLTLNVRNEKSWGLGSPLPGGSVRVYEPDSQGSLVYVGAAQLANSPVGQALRVTISEVFDIRALARVTGIATVNKKVRMTHELVALNGKDRDITVRIVSPSFWGRLIRESSPSRVINASMREWTVKIPARDKVKITFTVER